MYVRRSDYYEDEDEDQEEEDGEDWGGGPGIQHQHRDDRREGEELHVLLEFGEGTDDPTILARGLVMEGNALIEARYYSLASLLALLFQMS